MNVEKIQRFLKNAVAQELDCSSDDVAIDKPFAELGIESSALLGISGDLEDAFSLEIDPTLVFEYPTIETLAKHLDTL